MEKISNYHHNSTLYIPVKCTMQQSANGNMKQKTCDNKREVGLASPLPSASCASAVRFVEV